MRGFDPDFVYDYEDLDFGWRAGQAGMTLLYERAAVAEHLHPYDWATLERRYRSHAAGERVMAAKHEWFQPWFHGHITAAAAEPAESELCARVVDWIPQRPARVRKAFERRANRYYLQRLAPAFAEAWAEPRSVVRTLAE